MNRFIPLAVAGIVLAGGGLLVWARVAELPPDHLFCRAGLCGNAPKTIANDPLNPFAWSDLAEERVRAGDDAGARQAFARSLELGPNVPPILIRYVNYAVDRGDLGQVIPQVRHILALTSAYDNVLFRYLSRSGLRTLRILEEVIPDPGQGSGRTPASPAEAARHASAPSGEARPIGEAARGWLQFLIADRSPEADGVYVWLDRKGGITPAVRSQWIEYLIDTRKEYSQAVQAWASAHESSDYPERNRVFNPRFALRLSGSRMDWRMTEHPHAGTVFQDGLMLTFDGRENTVYSHLQQQTYIPAGRWRFSVEASAQGLTTNQRPFFRITDATDPRRLDVSTPMAPEPMTVEFTSPAGGSWVSITLLRRQSEKFDNKIQGSLRLREVRIGPA